MLVPIGFIVSYLGCLFFNNFSKRWPLLHSPVSQFFFCLSLFSRAARPDNFVELTARHPQLFHYVTPKNM